MTCQEPVRGRDATLICALSTRPSELLGALDKMPAFGCWTLAGRRAVGGHKMPLWGGGEVNGTEDTGGGWARSGMH